MVKNGYLFLEVNFYLAEPNCLQNTEWRSEVHIVKFFLQYWLWWGWNRRLHTISLLRRQLQIIGHQRRTEALWLSSI